MNLIKMAVTTKRAKFTRLQTGMIACQAGAISISKSQNEAAALFAALQKRGFKVIDRQGATVFLHS